MDWYKKFFATEYRALNNQSQGRALSSYQTDRQLRAQRPDYPIVERSPDDPNPRSHCGMGSGRYPVSLEACRRTLACTQELEVDLLTVQRLCYQK